MASSFISQLGSTSPTYQCTRLHPSQSAQPLSLQFAAANSSPFQQTTLPAQPFRLRFILTLMTRYMRPDATLYRISELTPKRLRTLGDIKGVIFDLDDTLSRLFTGQLTEETIRSLHRLKIAGYQMGIVTNNIQPAYCERIRSRLAEAGLDMPFIEDARKPSAFGFETMRKHFNLRPSQMVVVGDGLISDIVGAKRLGYKAIRAHWHTKNYLLCREPFLTLWDSLAITLNAVRIWLFTRRTPQLTGIPTAQER